MSTRLEKPLTATQRSAEAARQAAELLGLQDVKAVAAALAETALRNVRRDPAFADHVRLLYNEMAKTARPKRAPAQPTAERVELVPREQVTAREPNPGGAPDPYYLLELYGADQLAFALARYKVADLKLAAELVQQRNPGTKPTNKGNRDALIAYIVQHVTA